MIRPTLYECSWCGRKHTDVMHLADYSDGTKSLLALEIPPGWQAFKTGVVVQFMCDDCYPSKLESPAKKLGEPKEKP